MLILLLIFIIAFAVMYISEKKVVQQPSYGNIRLYKYLAPKNDIDDSTYNYDYNYSNNNNAICEDEDEETENIMRQMQMQEQEMLMHNNMF